jgi:hypothetical protein
VSFTLDGIKIETLTASMARLACDSAEIELGVVQIGEFVACVSCTDERGGVVLEFCQVTEVLPTQIVPTVHI